MPRLNSSTSFDKNKGFTLIEVLTVITILAVLMALAAPSFTGMFERWNVSTTKDSLGDVLSLARQEAVRTSKSVNITRLEENTACRPNEASDVKDWSCGVIIYRDENTNNKFDAGEEIIKEISEFKGTTVLRRAANSNNPNGGFGYNSLGMPKAGAVAGNGSFVIFPTAKGLQSSNSTTLCINWSGSIRVVVGSAASLCR